MSIAAFCEECFGAPCTCAGPDGSTVPTVTEEGSTADLTLLRSESEPSEVSEDSPSIPGSDGSDGSDAPRTPRRAIREILDDLVDFAGDYIAWPQPEMGVAWALWVAHTYLLDDFDSTPRLAVVAPEKQSGKTRVLEVTESVTLRPSRASDVSTAALFRMVGGEDPPTLLLDEADAIWSGKGANEELRALVNGGHRRGNFVLRMTGEGSAMKSTKFDTFAAIALAGIGDLPDTVMDRSVVLRMKRRRPTDRIKRWRFRNSSADGAALGAELFTWAASTGELPEVPDDPEIIDRAFDVWEPLFTIADLAGGEWPDLARQACKAVTLDTSLEDYSLALRCVMELRTVWPAGQRFASTAELLAGLTSLEDSIWSATGDGPFENGLSPRKIAVFLKKYDVHPTRNSAGSARGYHLSDLQDAWARYAPVRSESEASEPSEAQLEIPEQPTEGENR